MEGKRSLKKLTFSELMEEIRSLNLTGLFLLAMTEESWEKWDGYFNEFQANLARSGPLHAELLRRMRELGRFLKKGGINLWSRGRMVRTKSGKLVAV